MRTSSINFIAAGALGLVLCSTTIAPSAAPTTDARWLDQLVGKWEGDVGGDRYVEEWHKVNADTYEGKAVTWKGDQAVSSEELRLTLFSGHWLYLVNPGGQGVSCFVRNSANATTWIFENNEHDFPKRIGYRIAGETLMAWIAGKNDQSNRMEFNLTRVR
jgi:hypothetical protein